LASCAVPFVYKPVRIHQRKPDGSLVPFAKGAHWIDGSAHADLPARDLRERYGVTRLIASIVNPFELPLLTDRDYHGPILHNVASTSINLTRSLWSIGLSAIIPVTRQIPVAGRMMSLWKQVLDQRIDADVIIAPGQRFNNPIKLLEQISHEQMSDFIAEGEAAAMARLHLIEPALRIESALRAVKPYQSTAKRMAKVSTP
jgi:TAG lipase / steryl ester hydrolase / phospholipase A2 / LPA acyltransferase